MLDLPSTHKRCTILLAQAVEYFRAAVHGEPANVQQVVLSADFALAWSHENHVGAPQYQINVSEILVQFDAWLTELASIGPSAPEFLKLAEQIAKCKVAGTQTMRKSFIKLTGGVHTACVGLSLIFYKVIKVRKKRKKMEIDFR